MNKKLTNFKLNKMKQMKTILNKKVFFLFFLLVSVMNVHAQLSNSAAQTFCQGTGIKSYEVDYPTGTFGSSYAWSVTSSILNQVPKPSTSGTNSTTIDWTSILPGNYVVQVIETNNGCSVTTLLNVTIIALPAAPTASPQTLCSGSTVANLVATGTAINWYAAPTVGTALASTASLTSGNYYATQTIGTCESARSAAVAVTIQAVPASAGSNGNLKICAGTSVSATSLYAALGGTPATGGTWSATTGGAGTYTYTQAATSPCTTANTATVTVTEQAVPASAGTNGSLVICAGNSVSATSLYAALGGTPATGGTWSATTGGAGTYTYTQAATSPCTTANTATITVTEQAIPITSAIFHD
jgi:hypothetical protein